MKNNQKHKDKEEKEDLSKKIFALGSQCRASREGNIWYCI